MIKEDSPKNYRSDKVISLAEAVEKSEELRKQGRKAGLCNGGFDLLHPGHIKHLESAKKLCDCLFVAVTADRFVAARKGSGRPIFSEALRAYSVASIRYVDYVIVSDFEKATDLIKMLKPAYYIKGPDFAEKTTPGITSEREAIKAVGGEIKYTTDQKMSTTAIIRHIQENAKSEKVLLVIDRDGTLVEKVNFLGKDSNWRDQIKLKKEVVDLLIYIQTKYDTVRVVISNQQGVARGYFDAEKVEAVNKHIHELLRRKGVIINNWQYCPDADADYAALQKEANFNPDFVKKKTKRKPSPEMLLQALQQLGKNIKEFDKAAVIGNSEDDAGMARNANAAFIDVTDKSYEELKNEFDKVMER
ncbi:HAD-IIIA family hydrolase [Candidatus Woesearchaeota archaeon]|nr:HAD-IIIA family hydrolase [Candidatus Woesearchaeota archaeon]